VSPIIFETRGRVGLIRLDDGKANAMNDAVFGGLHDALDAALASDVRAVVFLGRPRFFSAGMDLKLIPTLAPEDLVSFAARFGECMLRIFGFELPTVAALEGHAIGGGAILAFACDLQARQFGWADAAAAGMVDEYLGEEEDLLQAALASGRSLAAIDRNAYAETKKRLRAQRIQDELERLEGELRQQIIGS
jgi:enoyl-CoA hydratase/carnithine racemase